MRRKPSGEWLNYHPLAQLCLTVQVKKYGKGSRAGESWGACTVEKSKSGLQKITGVGRTQRADGGFSISGSITHAEMASASDAVFSEGDPRLSTVYVAGGNLETGTAFFNPESSSFTCSACAKFCNRLGIQAFGVPRPYGWEEVLMADAVESAKLFGQAKRKQERSSTTLRSEITAADTRLNLPDIHDITPTHIKQLMANLEQNGYEVSPHVATFLKLFPILVHLPPDAVRLFREGQYDSKLAIVKVPTKPHAEKYRQGIEPFLFSVLPDTDIQKHRQILNQFPYGSHLVRPNDSRQRLLDHLADRNETETSSTIVANMEW